jgi:hypothetical protein
MTGTEDSRYKRTIESSDKIPKFLQWFKSAGGAERAQKKIEPSRAPDSNS